MFEVGDLAIIRMPNDGIDDVDEGSPVDNLTGSIVKIKERRTISNTYGIEMVELTAKDPRKYASWQMDLAWSGRFLEPFSDLPNNIQESDVMSLLQEG